MPQIDVKITDLEEIARIKNDDLFLIAHPLVQVDGNPIANYPYTSNSISGGALSSSLREMLESNTVCVDTGDWHFHTTIENIPTQDVKLNTDDFISALEDANHLSSIIHDDDSKGWYHKLSSSYLQNPSKRSDLAQSLSVTNNSIPNIDFVERAIAGAYQSLLNQLTTIISPSGDSHFIPTHVGEIVYSTRFSKADYSADGITATGFNLQNPASATNIRQFYGYGQTINGVKYPNTKWILHSGYFLRGANSNVVKNSTSDGFGGQDSKKYDVPLKNHEHALSSAAGGSVKVKAGLTNAPLKSITAPDAKAEVNESESGRAVTSVTGHNFNKGDTFGSGSISWDQNAQTNTAGDSDDPKITVDHLPRYKNVYIWERIA